MKQKLDPRIWILTFFLLVIGVLAVAAGRVVRVDPFFHYHQPDTERYYYSLDNERSQNDGIIRHFEYDALITGTSMTENFKTSEMDRLFGTNAVKVSYAGATYKEINDNLSRALKCNPDLKIIVRGVDMSMFTADKDIVRTDMGEYPAYLYDDNIWNDVRYIFNRNVIFDRTFPMMLESGAEDFKGGITPFDAYADWMGEFSFGVHAVLPEGMAAQSPNEPVHLTEEEKDTLLGNVRQNITALAEEYPDVTFYYFFPPYSAVWWERLRSDGTIYRQCEAEEAVIEEILQYENIKLFSFNHLTDITTNMNHYKDDIHYGSWINSLILSCMHDGRCLLTYENYKEYLEKELEFYLTFDYDSLNGQIDYEDDYFAETLIEQ